MSDSDTDDKLIVINQDVKKKRRVYPKKAPEVIEKEKKEHNNKLDEVYISTLIDNKLKSYFDTQTTKQKEKEEKEKRRQELKEDLKEALKEDSKVKEVKEEVKIVEKPKRKRYPPKPKEEIKQEVKPPQSDYYTDLINSFR